MARKKSTKETESTEKTEEVKVDTVLNEAQQNFLKFIEEYKQCNPEKYEAKKESLLAKLNSLK